MVPMWGMNSPAPIHRGKWTAGWRHTPPLPDDIQEVFINRTAAWVWLRIHLNWMLDDNWTDELFRAAMSHSTSSGDSYGAANYVVGDTDYFMEPHNE